MHLSVLSQKDEAWLDDDGHDDSNDDDDDDDDNGDDYDGDDDDDDDSDDDDDDFDDDNDYDNDDDDDVCGWSRVPISFKMFQKVHIKTVNITYIAQIIQIAWPLLSLPMPPPHPLKHIPLHQKGPSLFSSPLVP